MAGNLILSGAAIAAGLLFIYKRAFLTADSAVRNALIFIWIRD